MSLASIIGLGYSGYAVIDGVPILLLPSSIPETENLIKSEGSFHPNPAMNAGQLPARQKRSLTVSFQTNVSSKTLALLEPLTYGWRNAVDMDGIEEFPFAYILGTREGYDGWCHIDDVTLTSEPENMLTMSINLTSWRWTEIGGDTPLTRLGTPALGSLGPLHDPGYKPIAGWNSSVKTNVIGADAIVQRYTLKLTNNWTYQGFLNGYPAPPNPALITAGALDVSLDIAWLAQRKDRPKNSGWFQIWIGGDDPANGDALKTIYLDRMIREPRSFEGGGPPNSPILWSATYNLQGPIPRSS